MESRDHTRQDFATPQPPGGAWGTSEPRDLADAARQRLDDAKRGASGYAAEAKQYVQEAVEQSREYVGDALNQARDKVADKVAEYRQAGFEKVKHDVSGYTREQPVTALLIAAGAGLILGWLSAAGRR